MKQRKTKYRTWDKENKVMITFNNMERCDVSFYEMARGEYGFILMQYTGLKDKSGKEIYEGDIVSNGNKNKKYEDIFEIYFDRGEFLAGCKRGIIGGKTLGFWSDNLEVIGNIYENPELLSNQ